MEKNNIITFVLLSLGLASLAGCDGFLDKLPDNRAEMDSESKIQNLLVSAYPRNDFMLLTEFMSDNVDDMGAGNPYTDRFIDQVYAWSEITETDNEAPENVWNSSYYAIAAANQALQAIEDLGGPATSELKAAKAEALLCRAYNHFILTNLFCKSYNPSTSEKDLGIPYSEEPETTLVVHHERGTVAEDYERMDADIQEALPLQADSYFSVPKYHFNKKAAYAFAARFYLFYQKWDKAEEYASRCLGSAPETMLRDWKATAGMTQTYDAIVSHFIDASLNCNLLLLTAYSKMGLAFGPYYLYSKYAHNNHIATTEDVLAANIWRSGEYYMPPKVYKGTNLDKTVFWKLPYLFEYTDAVAGIGYYRTVYPAFWCDETLLVRAEARTMLEKFDEAAADLTLWMKNIVNTETVLDPSSIRRYYNAVKYSTWDSPTIKKKLNPSFDIGMETSVKEAMIQCVLGFRRIETLGQGLRWFDVNRYGICIDRRTIGADGEPERVTDSLKIDDLRRALQIPRKVIDAGLEANPR